MGLTLLALIVEAAFGYPPALLARIGHPAIWLGGAVDALDAALNRGTPSMRRAKGFLALALLLGPCFGFGFALQRLLLQLPFGVILLAVAASSLLAQRSLYAHVAEVAQALDNSLEDGRRMVAKIVGRDVSRLDDAGIARAAIESLAENFSDGIVAPALWLSIAGLPGALCYKAINTADSMIGHRTPRFEAFGFAAARLDDLVNLPAARLSAALLALAAAVLPGASWRGALGTALRDAGKHASPNAGWPEAAMAGALGFKLGGPRCYGQSEVAGATLGEGRSELNAQDIRRALTLYRFALAALWLGAAAFAGFT